jgi:hypothetical protein
MILCFSLPIILCFVLVPETCNSGDNSASDFVNVFPILTTSGSLISFPRYCNLCFSAFTIL